MAKKKKGGSVDFTVTASGLNKVDKDAKKAGKSFNQLDKNARSADRAGKGVANMSSNVTKNFSKMSQGITGGLVPAYATLAAQLFAIDALFRFLKDAADFRVLMEGQEAFAAATGRAMKTISREVQAATEAQITFKEASQASAIGLAAGLSPTQLKELGESAKIVSVALGRDVTDSFNRLVRGVTKAEPELLDELGIILRLEEASTRYAAALGLNKNQLTTFQKSQAVANEVLRQSEERYGAIADALGSDSVNQLNKLAVAFDEVLNNVRKFIGPIAEFFGTFLADNIESATAALGVFAATLSGALIRGAMPTIDYGRASQQAATVAGAGDLKESARFSKKRIKRLSTPGKATDADIKAYARVVAHKKSINIDYENFTRREHERTVKIMQAQRERMVADAKMGFARMKANFKADLYEMQAEHGKAMGMMKFAGMQLGKVMSGIMRLAGIVGIAIMIFQFAKDIVQRLRGVDKTIEKLEKKTADLTETQKQLNEELSRTADLFEKDIFTTRAQEIEAVGNAFQSADLENRMNSYTAMERSLGSNNESVVALREELFATFQELGKFNPKFLEFGEQLKENPELLNRSTGEMRKLTQGYILDGQAVKSLTEATANYQKQLNKFTQALPKVPYQDVLMAQNEMLLSLEQLRDATGNTSEETENYKQQIEKLKGEMAAFDLLSKGALKTQQVMTKIRIMQTQSANAIFGDKASADRAAKVAVQMQKMFEAQIAVFNAERAMVGTKGPELAIRQEQLKLAKQQEELILNQLAAVAMMENAFVRVNKQIMEGLTSDLGKAFGKALRQEKDAFKDFGKGLAKALTDQMGKKVAEQIMKITYGGTPLDPSYQQEQFKQSLKDSFKEGFTDGDSPLQQGGSKVATNIHDAMVQAANTHVQGLYNAQLGLAKSDKIAADQAVQNQKKIVENYEKTISGETLATIEGAQDANDAAIKAKEQEIQDYIDSPEMSKAFLKMMQERTQRVEMAHELGQTPNARDVLPNMGRKKEMIEETAQYKKLIKELEGLEKKSTDLSEDIANNSKSVSIAKAEIDGARKSLKKFEANADEAATALEGIQGGAPKTLSSVYSPEKDGDGSTDDDDGATPSTGYVAGDYFGKKAQEMFPGIFGALAGDDPNKASFGQNVLSFGTAVTQFATLTAQGLAIAGKNEEAADIMMEVAKINMALAMAEFLTTVGGYLGVRYGGMVSPSGKSFSQGGISQGPERGYSATLHGTEAVVPLGNDRSIPVKLEGAAGTNNVNVSVNIDQSGQAESMVTGDGARELGKTIAAIATDTIAKEQRAGGLLSSI